MNTLRPLIVLATVALVVMTAACSGGSNATESSLDGTPTSAATVRASETALPKATPTVLPATPTAEPEPTATPEAPPPPTPVPAAPVAAQPTVAPPVPPPPVQAPPPTPVPAAGPPPPVSFAVTASLLSFNVATLSATSGAAVSVSFTNTDAGVAHDLSFSVPGLGHGHTCVGPCSDAYSFTAPAPGRYDFFCTIHQGMQGTFTVTP
jgi:plastocyanin